MAMLNKSILMIMMTMSFFSTFISHANEKKTIESELTFTIHPALCVLTRNKSHCQQSIVFEFKQQPANSICIFVVKEPNSKQCYQINDSSSFSYNIKTNKSVYLVIEDSSSQQVLGRAEFKIAEYQPVRKRRRFSWGLL